MENILIKPGVAGRRIVSGQTVSVPLPGTPARYYWHGWQSWSLAAWVDASRLVLPSKPAILHPMQIDPAFAFHPHPHGSWVGAAEMQDGAVVLLGALGTDAHVELAGNELIGRYEDRAGEWLVAVGDERAIFANYAQELEKRFGARSIKPVPRVWSSWYSLYEGIDESSLSRIIDDLGDLPFDVIQVDDGWQLRVGDWEANRKFPSGMQTLQLRIKATGRDAGIWLAPLIAVKSSRLFRDHPDWFLRDERGRLVSAGFNWGEQLYALDTTHPLVTQWLKGLIQKMRAWGYRYLKLDFLYAGALPGVRHNNMPREQAYRQALGLMRDVMGDDAYLLACGAPIIPSLGLCDALRIGPDVAASWETELDAVLLQNPAISGVRNAIRTTVNRLWLRDLVQTDPDAVYFSASGSDLTSEQRELQQGLALISGFKSTSDLPGWLSGSERDQLRTFLTANPRIQQTDHHSFQIDERELDYDTAMGLPEAPTGQDVLKGRVVGWLAERPWAIRIHYLLATRAAKRRLKMK